MVEGTETMSAIKHRKSPFEKGNSFSCANLSSLLEILHVSLFSFKRRKKEKKKRNDSSFHPIAKIEENILTIFCFLSLDSDMKPFFSGESFF